MSYYHNKKINGKYMLTHHAKRRIRERMFGNDDISEIEFLAYLESLMEDAITLGDQDNSSDIKLFNYELNIEIVVTEDNLIKTVIKK